MEEINIQEVKIATRALNNNKAAGLDEISAEMLKQGGDTVAEELTHLFNIMWREEDVPQDWRQGVIIKLPKNGSLSDCNNWRGMTLLSVQGKVFCRVLLNRLRPEVDKKLREEQAGFREGRSCNEQIFTLRNIIEQSLEFNRELLINYIDFKKAFDSIHRDSLCKIATLYGIPDKYVNIFKALYRDSACCIRIGNKNTRMFNITTGVRQGCVLSTFLFLMVMDFIMKKAINNPTFGIEWGTDRLADLDFADDVALLSRTLDGLQEMSDNIQEIGAKVGLRISSEKTKAMTIGQNEYPPVVINQRHIEYVDSFQYLGSYTSRDGDVEMETRTRIGKAASVFQKMSPVWKSGTISRDIKLRLYSSIVIPTAIYACETWKRTKKISQRLNVFHRRCLRTILGISWRDHISNKEVMKMTGSEDLEITVETRRRNMIGRPGSTVLGALC